MTLDEYIEQRRNELIRDYQRARERDDMPMAARAMTAYDEINRVRILVHRLSDQIGPSEIKEA